MCSSLILASRWRLVDGICSYFGKKHGFLLFYLFCVNLNVIFVNEKTKTKSINIQKTKNSEKWLKL